MQLIMKDINLKMNTLIVYSDNREQALDELRKLLEPQGFVHNPIGGGSTMGRLEIKDSKRKCLCNV